MSRGMFNFFGRCDYPQPQPAPMYEIKPPPYLPMPMSPNTTTTVTTTAPEVREQPPPSQNELPAVWDLVLQDMAARDKLGQERYGTRLQPHNGRDMLRDALEEALDMVVYLRGAIYERDGK